MTTQLLVSLSIYAEKRCDQGLSDQRNRDASGRDSDRAGTQVTAIDSDIRTLARQARYENVNMVAMANLTNPQARK